MAELNAEIDAPTYSGNGTHSRNFETGPAPSLTELVSGIMTDAQTLFRQQVQMLRAEVREDIRFGTQAATCIATGTVLGFASLGMFSIGAAYLIGYLWPAIPTWACFGIISAVLAAAGIAACLVGRNAYRKFHSLPEKTINAAQENLSWITKPQN